MNGLGEFLRAEREKRFISVEQVASATKINVRLLCALESENFDILPAKPFVRGFVISYCRYLTLDPNEVLNRFDTAIAEKTSTKLKKPAEASHIFVDKDPSGDNQKTVLTFIMLGFMLIAGVAFVFLKPSLKRHKKHHEKVGITNDQLVTVALPPSEPGSVSAVPLQSEHAEPPKAPVPPPVIVASPPVVQPPIIAVPKPAPSPSPKAVALPEAPKPAEVVHKVPEPPKASVPMPSPSPSPSPSSAPAVPKVAEVKPAPPPSIPDNEVKYRFVVRAKEDSWVKYQADDRPLQQYMLRQGKTIYVRARTAIRFTTGNPKGLEVSENHQAFKPYVSQEGKMTYLPKDSAESYYKDKPFN